MSLNDINHRRFVNPKFRGLQLTVRGGKGTEAFYAKLGYSEVGRLPGALRVADGDDRDEIFMWLPLT